MYYQCEVLHHLYVAVFVHCQIKYHFIINLNSCQIRVNCVNPTIVADTEHAAGVEAFYPVVRDRVRSVSPTGKLPRLYLIMK